MSKGIPPPGAAVVVGGSAGVGRALAERLATGGYSLVIAASGERDLKAVADPSLDPDGFLRWCLEEFPSVSALFIPAGLSLPGDEELADDAAITRIIAVNFLGPARLIGAFARHFAGRGSGMFRIAGFSSVAAAVPRRRNMAYAASKAGLEAYTMALRHRFAGSGLIVQCYSLGYVDTSATFGRRLFFRPVSPRAVAERVVSDSRSRSRGVTYYPGYWKWVVRAIRLLPWAVYRRMTF